MSAVRWKSPFVAWLACVAILTGAIAPSMARAIASARGLPAVVADLCSASGGGRVVIRAPDPQEASGPGAPAGGPAPRSTADAAQCPACLGAPDPVAPPPVSAAAFVLVAATHALPGFAPRPAPFRRAWPAASPRAPPRHA